MNNRKYIFLLIIFILTANILKSQSFTNFLKHLDNLSPENRQAAIDSLRLHNNRYPFTESDTTVYYICFSKAQMVQIAGDETGWKPLLNMQPVAGCNLCYYRATYPSDARLEYKYVYNGKDWCLDSLNTRKADGGFGQNSELAMPAYKPSKFLEYRKDIPHGRLVDTAIFSNNCKEMRRFKVFLPAGYSTTDKAYPLVIYHDGEDYLKYADILNILDNLSAPPLNRSVIAVFVIPVQRDPEYSGVRKNEYTAFIAEELMPFLQKNYRILPGASNHVTSGISNGGNISLWLAVNYPTVFGKVAVHSSNIENYVLNAFKHKKILPERIYVDIGSYDMEELVTMFNNLVRVMKERSCNYRALTVPSGHNWNSWRNNMGEALLYLFSNQ